MNKKIKAKWVKALRSGKYKKGIGALKTDEGKFCCLGVLCDLHAKEKGRKWEKDSVGNPEYLGELGLLPPMVANWAGLRETEDPETKGTKLSEWNDDLGAGFKKIANMIEAEL